MAELKVYFASRFRRRFELQEYARQLGFLGIGVTSHWLYEDEADKEVAAALADLSNAEPFARRDLEDIRNAHAVVCFSKPTNTMHDNNGGYHVEFGYALALGLVPVVVGPLENLFHSLKGVTRFDEWSDDVMAFLHELEVNKKYGKTYQ